MSNPRAFKGRDLQYTSRFFTASLLYLCIFCSMHHKLRCVASCPHCRSSSPPQPRSDQDQLAALLQAFGGNSASSNAPAASHYGDVPYTLPDIATPSSLAPLLSNPAVRQRLAQHLPPGLDNSQETLQSVVHSPELRRSLAGLDQALRTGALGPLVQSLGLKPDAALSVDSFLQGLFHFFYYSTRA